MRFPVVLIVALVCSACFGGGRPITTGVNATRPVEDLRNCAAEQLRLLGYTITDSSSPVAVQAVRPWASQTQFTGWLDRIDMLARNTTDRVVVGAPSTSLSATVRTLNGERRGQTVSEQVRADASRVLAACAPQ